MLTFPSIAHVRGERIPSDTILADHNRRDFVIGVESFSTTPFRNPWKIDWAKSTKSIPRIEKTEQVVTTAMKAIFQHYDQKGYFILELRFGKAEEGSKKRVNYRLDLVQRGLESPAEAIIIGMLLRKHKFA